MQNQEDFQNSMGKFLPDIDGVVVEDASNENDSYTLSDQKSLQEASFEPAIKKQSPLPDVMIKEKFKKRNSVALH